MQNKKRPTKNPHAQALGRLGGLARGAALTPQKRQAIGRLGAFTRWARREPLTRNG
jgi:hypothetical protein